MSKAKLIILASQSAARISMLKSVGLGFDTAPADIDEQSIIQEMLKENQSPVAIAGKLAQEKALHVARSNADALVIGADQVLECGGELMSKAKTTDEARGKLKTLSGKTHSLVSAVCVARGDEVLWEGCEQAHLTMHDLSEKFLDDYIAKAGDALTTSVGAYQLENEGAWLFEKIEGDYFTILGMPLLPLLNYLRTAQGGNL